MMIDEKVDAMVAWQSPVQTRTGMGDFWIRTGPATELVRAEWQARGRELAEAGYSLCRDRKGRYSISHWGQQPQSEIDAVKKIQSLSYAQDSDMAIPTPPGLNLYPYQKAGVSFAWERRNALIADEMGVGKTVQAIGVTNLMHARESLRWILVVTLTSVKINWQREFLRWSTADVEVKVGDAVPAEGLESLFQTLKPRVLILNYGRLHRWQKILLSHPWDVYIADEAHHLKNRKSQRGAVGLEIQGRRKLFLTGTPLENKPKDLWPLLHALQPQRYDVFFKFGQKFCDAKMKKIKGGRLAWDFTGASNLDKLKSELRGSVMIRRLKAEVLPYLPRKRRQIIELPKESGVVDDELGLFRGHEENLLHLRIALEAAAMADDQKAFKTAARELEKGVTTAFNKMAQVRLKTAEAKLPVGILHLEELIAAGEKVVCFAHHRGIQSKLKAHFGAQAASLDGDMKSEERQENIDRFQGDKDTRLIIVSLAAGGTGINLTAATGVVFFELSWNPSVMLQAEDRAHRIGQSSSIFVHLLVLEGSIDVRMAQVLSAKLEIAGQALDGAIEEGSILAPWETQTASGGAAPEILRKEGEALQEGQVKAIGKALRLIASVCDTGRTTDHVGFGAIDAPIGHDLARKEVFTPGQAAVGLRLVKRYHRQIPTELLGQCMGEPEGPSGVAEAAQGILPFSHGPMEKSA